MTAIELTPAHCRSFIIPEGCAHGIQVLEENSELLYLHTAFYSPADEEAVRFDDPSVALAWPLPPTELSARDSKHPLLDTSFKGPKPMECRHCKAPLQHVFLDPGHAPLSNAYLSEAQLHAPEPTFPLKIFVCHSC